MSLEVTILKNRHSNAADADLLEPYIRDCDIFSMEAASSSFDQCAYLEKRWAALLHEVKNLNLRDETLSIYLTSKGIPLNGPFGARLTSLVLKHKKPLLVMERFPERKSKLIANTWQQVNFAINEGVKMYLAGDKHGGASYIMNATSIADEQVIAERDKNIAKNLLSAEKRAYKLYSNTLPRKKTNKLNIQLGYTHNVENYTRMPINVIQIFDPKIEIEQLPVLEFMYKCREPNFDLEKDGFPILNKITPEMLEGNTRGDHF